MLDISLVMLRYNIKKNKSLPCMKSELSNRNINNQSMYGHC